MRHGHKLVRLPNIIPKFLKSYKKLSSEEIILFTPKNVPFAKNFWAESSRSDKTFREVLSWVLERFHQEREAKEIDGKASGEKLRCWWIDKKRINSER